MLVLASVMDGQIERGREALRTLDANPAMVATEALKAMHCAAEAEVAIHEGDFKGAAQKLRHAVRHWRDIGSRVGEADTRLRLAECLLQDHDPMASDMELHAVESNLASVAAAYSARLGALRSALRDGEELRRRSA